MKTLTLELPTLYGDHHVIEVRRILLETPGVEDVYASSSFHVVEIQYDPEKVSEEDLKTKLDDAGYLGDFDFPIEAGTAAYLNETGQNYFRHTAVYGTTKQVVSFAQNVSYSGKPLWPCPGMGVIKVSDE